MSPEAATWAWVTVGGLLVLSELVLPGLVAFFLGVAAMAVAGARALGWVEGPWSSGTMWFFSSIGLTVAFRGLLRRLMPGTVEKGQVEEDVEAFGKVVEVTETIEPGREGRIRFAGATWRARSLGGRLEVGQKAQLVFRDNVTWTVEPIEDDISKETR